MSLVFRLGFVRVVLVVRGAVVWWVRRECVKGMMVDWLVLGWYTDGGAFDGTRV